MFVELSQADGSYQKLKADWKAQCEAVGEDAELYARGTFIVLDELAAKPEKRARIYAVLRDGVAEMICQANTTPLPNHPEPVLRVRMLTVSPDIDFGATAPDRYIDALVNMFFGIISENHNDMVAKEVKFHLRSPEDFNFFRAVSGPLAKVSALQSVEVKGAWLYVTKQQ